MRIKTIWVTVFICVFSFGTYSSNAQFFKKLAKHAEQKVKREAERRSERRVDKSIDKGFDKTEQQIDKKPRKRNNKNKQATALKPQIYRFDWQVDYLIQSGHKKAKDMVMSMLFNTHKDYVGMQMPQMEDMKIMSITDPKTGQMIMLMDMNGQKIQQVTNINDMEEEDDSPAFEITKINSKKILGHTCQGYQTKTDEGILKFYIYKNAPVHFKNMNAFSNKQLSKIPPSLLKDNENGLMMEMDFQGKKKKDRVKMTCVNMKKIDKKINTAIYRSGMSN